MMITFSWDDGHPSDLRMADLMHKYGIRGTFYCPATNREGLPTLTASELQQLATSFEIGGHTFSHAYYGSVSRDEWIDDCIKGKNYLEDVLQQQVVGFCYPGGKVDNDTVVIVKEAGFLYSRTTTNFCFHGVSNSYLMPTTLQFYPHSKTTLVKNYLKNFGAHKFSRLGLNLLLAKDFDARLTYIQESVNSPGAEVLHIWGHSWEIEDLDLFPKLEQLFRGLSNSLAPEFFVTNRELSVQRR